jgi:type 1 fimbria pilin
MKNFNKCLTLAVILTLGLLMSCSDDNDSPTSPLGPVNVSGTWSFSGQLTKNTCEFDTGTSRTGKFTFTQTGSNVSTGRVDHSDLGEGGEGLYFYYSGTVNGNSVSLAATDPYVLQNGGEVVHFGSGMEIQNISDDSGDGSLNITGQCVQGCSGSCQTIWTGTWTKN